jgi:DNA end-binding protein Ku
MANAIWNGVISFGLLNIPVALRSGQRSTDLHFRMLDSRDNSPIRFERVNAETGEEVPWKDIVKAFEYEKGNYVVLQQEDFKAAAPDSLETVEIQSFVDRESINPMYYEKPYYLVPAKKAEKGYVLLREVLRKSNRIALGKVVIRTREYLCGLIPVEDAIVMVLLRFPQEIVAPDEFKLPGSSLSQYRISEREVTMAEQLVESMTVDFDPSAYVDDFRKRLHEVIDTRIRAKEGTVSRPEEESEAVPETATTNVVDFMALLRKSLDGKKKGDGGRKGEDDPSDEGDEPDQATGSGSTRKPAAKSRSARAAKSKGGESMASEEAKAARRSSDTGRGSTSGSGSSARTGTAKAAKTKGAAPKKPATRKSPKSPARKRAA